MKLFKNTYFKLALLFAVLIGFMVLSRLKEGNHILLNLPDNRGIEELWTQADALVAQEVGGRFHIFDWNNLKQKSQTLQAANQPALLLADHSILAVKAKKNLILENAPGRTLAVPIAGNYAEISLHADPTGQRVIAAQLFIQDDAAEYRLLEVDLSRQIALEMTSLQGVSDFKLRQILIPDASDLLIVVGSNNRQGYAAVINRQLRKVIWQKPYPDQGEFYSVCFVEETNSLYAGTRNGSVVRIDAASGDVLNNLTLLQSIDNITPHTIQRVVLSPDRTTLAASCDPAVYLIDIETLKVKSKLRVTHKIISGVSFSPDGRYLATSDIRAGGPIEIFDLSESKK